MGAEVLCGDEQLHQFTECLCRIETIEELTDTPDEEGLRMHHPLQL